MIRAPAYRGSAASRARDVTQQIVGTDPTAWPRQHLQRIGVVAVGSTRVSEAGINISNIISSSKDHPTFLLLLDLEESDEEKVRALAAEFDSSENIVRVGIIKKS